jgi:hypothetical protein
VRDPLTAHLSRLGPGPSTTMANGTAVAITSPSDETLSSLQDMTAALELVSQMRPRARQGVLNF